MSWTIMAIVLAAAVLHAVWNSIVKAKSESGRPSLMVAIFGGLVALPALPFVPAPAPESWPYLLASASIQFVYFLLIERAYRQGDLSFAYPLMRGTAPLLTALAAGPLAGEELSAAGLAGILVLSGGILGLAGEAKRKGGFHAPTTLFALANAGMISLYSLADGIGVRLSGAPSGYLAWLFVAVAVPIGFWGWFRGGSELARDAARGWKVHLAAGACNVGAYSLILYAMTRAPIALVAALRETSVIIAALIAMFLLGERVTKGRLAAIFVVMAGAALLRLA